jgi:hypothetical protein
MNSNMGKSTILDNAVHDVSYGIDECINGGLFIDAKITYARLNEEGAPRIGIEILERENGEIIVRRSELTVSNGTVYPTMPLQALCDSNG